MFRYPRYVIKSGEVVVEEGDIKNVRNGVEFVVKPAFDDKIEDFLKPVFQQQYTMSFENYPVELERVHGLHLCDLEQASLARKTPDDTRP